MTCISDYAAQRARPKGLRASGPKRVEPTFYSILFYSILFYSILFYSIKFYSILPYSVVLRQMFLKSKLCINEVQITIHSFPLFLFVNLYAESRMIP